MTKAEAHAQLRQLRDEHCTCGEENFAVRYHDSRHCPYRIKAWMVEELRPFTGGLYAAAYAKPEPVAA